MERLFVHWLRVYSLAGIVAMFATLGAWAAWGSPSSMTLVWVAIVGTGLIVATALAIRDGSPTRSVAHVLYDTEHPAGGRPQAATTGATR